MYCGCTGGSGGGFEGVAILSLSSKVVAVVPFNHGLLFWVFWLRIKEGVYLNLIETIRDSRKR